MDDNTEIEAEVAAQKLRRYATEYMEAKHLATTSEKRRKDLREILLGMAQSQGTKDELGNRWLPAKDHMIKSERRSSITFDPAKAEKWLRAQGLWDEAKVVTPEETVVIPASESIDEDTLAAFIFNKRFDTDVPDDIPDEVYNHKDTFAIKVTKEEQYDY